MLSSFNPCSNWKYSPLYARTLYQPCISQNALEIKKHPSAHFGKSSDKYSIVDRMINGLRKRLNLPKGLPKQEKKERVENWLNSIDPNHKIGPHPNGLPIQIDPADEQLTSKITNISRRD